MLEYDSLAAIHLVEGRQQGEGSHLQGHELVGGASKEWEEE